MRLPSAYQGRQGGKVSESFTGLWFQPIWKICSSNWIISPGGKTSCQTLGAQLLHTLEGSFFRQKKRNKNSAPHGTWWFSARYHHASYVYELVNPFHLNFRGMRNAFHALETNGNPCISVTWRFPPWKGGVIFLRKMMRKQGSSRWRQQADSAKCSSIGLFCWPLKITVDGSQNPANHQGWWENPIIYRGSSIHPRWLFGISEPSTVTYLLFWPCHVFWPWNHR